MAKLEESPRRRLRLDRRDGEDDLAHSPIEHTVSALLLVWDGAQILADETGDLSAALGSPGTRRTITAAA